MVGAAVTNNGSSVYIEWSFNVVEFLVCQYPVLCLMVLLSILYLLWYSVMVVSKPVLYGGKDGLKDYLVKHCPLLTQPYRPTIWAWHYHGTTILRPLLQQCIPHSFDRQILALPDGGEVALDWIKQHDDGKTVHPVFLIIPGLSGDSSGNYVSHMIHDGLSNGYHCVVFNQRGSGNVPLKSPLMMAVTNIHDLEMVLDSIKTQYPQSPVIGAGVSFGGMMLTKYLHCAGSESKISACVAICTAWHIENTMPELEEKWLNRNIYVKAILDGLKTIVRENAEMITKNPKVDISRVMKTRRLSEFNEEVTAPLCGFESAYHYHTLSSVFNQMSNIKVPYLGVNSMDDPFSPLYTIPFSEFESNPNTLLVLTRHGGHFGFVEGLFPRGRSWMNRLVNQFLNAMRFKHDLPIKLS